VSKKYDPIALEILKMARELVLNEYTDKRAQDHNKWLAEFETVWKNNRVRLPYPDIPPYPTEKEIVKRAQTLMDFIHDNYSNTPTEPATDTQPTASNSDIEDEESLKEVVNEAILDTIKQPDIAKEEAKDTVPVPVKEKTAEGGFPSFFRKLTT
jgi:hypothetical protein